MEKSVVGRKFGRVRVGWDLNLGVLVFDFMENDVGSLVAFFVKISQICAELESKLV